MTSFFSFFDNVVGDFFDAVGGGDEFFEVGVDAFFVDVLDFGGNDELGAAFGDLEEEKIF